MRRYNTLMFGMGNFKQGIVYTQSNLRAYKEMCTEVVGSSYPGGEEAAKGLTVRQLKTYASNHVSR